jgi:threonylcarbamoyladenosine tRNA methylthiotransferase MtaB
VLFEEGADVAIINTCTVTHRADFQSRQMVRRALRRNPRSLVIVTGCSLRASDSMFLSRPQQTDYIVQQRAKRVRRNA